MNPDAIVIRMKEDAMKNGQTKPGYNLQIGRENPTGFYVDPLMGQSENPVDNVMLIRESELSLCSN